jgi:two-component system, cell cycle sensor histidine kinase and response regulator CckA
MTEQKQILVIDDDPDFLDFMRIVLTSNGYGVRTATSSREGLEMMREQIPDLVIADVMMSYVLDGWTVTREMRADPQLRCVPVMMVSAVVSDEDDGLFPTDANGRVDAFMSKPLDPASLLRHVTQLTQDS